MAEFDIRDAVLFDGMTEEDHRALARVGQRMSFLPGAAVFSGKLRADTLFVLAAGSVDVYRRDGDGKDHLVTTLEPGAVFGEAGLVDGQPRQAHGNARGSVVCWTLDSSGLTLLGERSPGTAARLLANLAEGMALRLSLAAAKVNQLADGDRSGGSVAGARRSLWDRLRGR